MEAVANMRPIWVRAKGATELFGIKRAALLHLVAEGRVTAKRIGACVFFKVADIDAAIEHAEDYR